ncbi:uncharacterized protein LY89DRAFT_713469 [Mollisia scopiformis]|uniref:Uncharacterized protein n=1 Tax=Mollisia scopiformis TaxID=149040 RepID=A0A194XX59_MOLSC|nr:uncharacterized protein LY89DRAFT_713469 [Mollisia scopiformis]KUJ24674.1 hypothetical protein LY89DRAFT_713469 [Mollisia scopiformis]
MTFLETSAVTAEFRRRQRERRERGGLRNRRHQRRGDDDEAKDAGDTKASSDDDDSPSQDESSKSSSQTRTSTSSLTSLSKSSQSLASASTTTSTLSQVTTTPVSKTSVALTSLRTSTSLQTTPLPVVTTPSATALPASTRSRQSSSTLSSEIATSQTTGPGISSKQSPNEAGSNKETVTILAVTGAIVGILALLALIFYIRRKFKRPKIREEEREARAYAARSIWGNSSTTSNALSHTTMEQFVPPITMGRSQNANSNGAGNDAVDRRECGPIFLVTESCIWAVAWGQG